MKNKIGILFLSLFITITNYAQPDLAHALPHTLPLSKQPEKIFVGVVENRQNQLEKVKQERTVIAKEKQENETELTNLIEETQIKINETLKLFEQYPASEFYKQKLMLLNESFQVFKDLKREREKTIAILDDLIKLLQEFLENPEYTHFRKEQKLIERPFYSFEDLQRINSLILDMEKEVALLQDQEKHTAIELENKKKAGETSLEVLKEKREQYESRKLGNFEPYQIKELQELEELLFQYKKKLDEIRIKEIQYKLDLISLEFSIKKSYLSIVKDYLKVIKPSVRVSEADIIYAKEELAKLTNKSRVIKEQYRSEIDRLVVLQDRIEEEIEELSKRFGIPVGKDLTEWTRDAQQTVDYYVAYCELGTLQTRLNTYQRKQELLDTQIELEDQKLKEVALLLQIKESYYKKFNTEEEITQELKKYEVPRIEAETGLSRFKEKITVLADQINTQKKILDNIQTLKQKIQKLKDTIFKTHNVEYIRCLELLRRAEALEKEQVDTLSKLAGGYSGLTAIMNNKLRMISFITQELESRTIWHRPEWAITSEGIKNFWPDLANFLSFVRSYFTQMSMGDLGSNIYGLLVQPLVLLFFIIKLLLVLSILFLIRRLLPPLAHSFIRQEQSRNSFIRGTSLLMGAIVEFCTTYFISIALWVLVFSAVLFSEYEAFYYILFYLFSIPYLIYLANRFFKYLSDFNKAHDYPFLAPDFQRRFFFVVSFLSYATITIYLFRHAFMLTHYYRSELPTILLALNFIIFQITLILLIDKEQILGLLPTKTDFSQWFYNQVDRFYYLILLLFIAVIVMSNPYVGFGRLVLYIFFGFIYSIALFIALYWLHGLFKRGASKVFFISIEDGARERFSNAKTWFGIAIIFSFLALTFIGLIVGAKIWGWPITITKIKELFSFPIIGGESKNPITLISFFQILLFVIFGFIIAYALNKFVLDRIFDLLLVDPGVQHTVSSISQYIVIIIAVFLGFQSAKLGEIVNYIIGALILGLGFILKEPIGDFVAYFIILVQRPVKIGDYIAINDEITGVVRKITARSVILRRKNSTTLIVPNSFVISHAITNWNYSRNFIAFDDIIVRVDYSEDPDEVRKVLYAVVEEHPNVLKNPKPWIRLDNFGEYGYEFMVRGFISSVYTLEKWDIASAIRISIAKRFDEKGIKFALPTRLLLTRTNMKLGESTNGVNRTPLG